MDTQKIIAYLKQHPIVVICGGVSLLLILAIVLRAATLDGIRTEYQEALDAVKVIDSNNANSTDLAAQVETAKKMSEDIESRLMKSADAQNEHFLYFATLAVDCDVNLTNPTQRAFYIAKAKGTPIKTEQASQLEYQLAVTGDFNKVMNYLYRLTTGRNFIRIQQLNINPAPAQPGKVVIANMIVRCLAVTPEKKKEEKDSK